MVKRKVLQTKGVSGDVSIISIENNGYVLICLCLILGMIGYRSLNIGVTSKGTISGSSHEMMEMI